MTAPTVVEATMTRLALEIAVDQLTTPLGLLARLAEALPDREVALLLGEIDLVLRTQRSRQGRAGRLRAWFETTHEVTDLDALELIARVVEEWVRRADALLDPMPVVDLPDHEGAR